MAKSGTFSTKHSGWTFSVDWKVTSQSPANLTSTIQMDAYLICAPSYDLYKSAISHVRFYAGDEERSVSVNPISTAGGETIKLGQSVTFTVKHTSAGAQSVRLRATWGAYATLDGTYVDVMLASQTVTLDALFAASQPSLVTWPETTNDVGDFGDTISIHMNRQSSELTHTVRYEYGSRSGTIATNVGTGTTWKIPLDFMNLIPNAVSGSGRIYVDTYHGSALIGTKYTGFTATVPASVKPSCTLTLDDVTGIDNTYGSPVQSLSKIKVTVNPTTAYSSPIKAYSISIDGVKYAKAEVTTNALRTAGDSVVTVSVTDQRGRTGTASYTMKVQAYAGPAITALTVHRCNADGTINDQGEYVKVTFSAAVYSLNSKNTAAYVLRYKKSTGTTYTSVALSALANKYAVADYSYIIAADSNSSYDIEVAATDRHSTITRSTSASTAFTLMNWGAGGTSLGIGKVAERANTMQIALDVEFIGKIRGTIFDAIYPVGSIYLSYNHTNPGTLFGGTWVRIQDAFLWATGATGTIGQTGGERTHVLTVDEMPKHTHGGTYTNAGTSRTHAWLASNGSAMGYDSVEAGGGAAHNNMPPYIQVSVWRKVANGGDEPVASGLNATDDGNGNVTMTASGSASITDDGNGNVAITVPGDATIIDDDNGNVTIA